MAGDLSGTTQEAPPVEAMAIPPALRREILALSLWTLLADLLIYRSFGYSGPALFFFLAPLLFFIGCPRLRRGPVWWLATGLMVVVAIRLLWLGSALAIFSAVVLVVAVAMLAAGCIPHVLEGFVLAGRSVIDGGKHLAGYRPLGGINVGSPSSGRVLAWVLPIAAATVFGWIFVFANPNLFDWVSTGITRFAQRVELWLEGFSFWELPFCVLALLVGAGLMRPALPMMRIGPAEPPTLGTSPQLRSPLFVAFRNTLVTLIVLFAVYLVFEFITLWKRDFPEGFYYAGYAHQGAAWLTFALALATAVLSFVFSGQTRSDPRLGLLRRLAWVWSAQNLLLAAAVYNRLMIYVGYNGMTRMRTVGFFGTTVVVVGFCLVLYKIRRDRSFWWLIRAQLTALVLTIIVYSVFPVDYVAHRYNARVVASGYLHPSVMIAVKPIKDEGVFPLLRLTDCQDDIIREGVLALLARRQGEIESDPATHWTEFQGSRGLLRRRLATHEAKWRAFRNEVTQKNAIAEFQAYAMQWY